MEKISPHNEHFRPGRSLPTPLSVYAAPGTVFSPDAFRFAHLTRLAGTPKFGQPGFLQKLTLIPPISGGTAGTTLAASSPENFFPKSKSPKVVVTLGDFELFQRVFQHIYLTPRA